ncbi:MAG: class I tRNA ligase family protein, partial [Candidatus Thermoplasmatota archaeon]|nr:class I tRNA ligase family protein [Candidatus Thermoplasmatota archaeon]
GGGNKNTIKTCVNAWLQFMTPITPHLCEELWNTTHDTLVSTSILPDEKRLKISESHVAGEKLVANLVDDIQEILNVTKIKPQRIIIYTAPNWKHMVLHKAINLSEENGSLNMGQLMKRIVTNPDLKKQAKQVSKYAGKLTGEIKKLNEKDITYYQTNIDETKYLTESKSFFESLFTCSIEIFSADDSSINDPKQKSRFAEPRRPAIYVE